MKMKIDIKNIFKKYKNSFLFGLLAGLSFPPAYLFIFLPICFSYIINKTIKLDNKKEVFFYSFIFGIAYFLSQLYWISFSLFVDLKMFFWLVPLAMIFIPILCSLFFAPVCVLLNIIANKLNLTNKFAISVIFAFLYILFEFLKGLIFPWNLFSYIVGFSDIMIQPVSIVNIYIYNFVLLILFLSFYVLFDFENKKLVFNKEYKFYIPIYILTLLSIFLFGFFRLDNVEDSEKNNTNMRLIQANIKQSLKWDSEEVDKNLSKHISLSNNIDNGINFSNIIVWAETSISYPLTEKTKINFLQDKILISGAIRAQVSSNNQIEKMWNSIFVFKDGKVYDYYDKSILVPFGEYIPFSKYIPFVKKITNGAMNFSKGNPHKNITINGLKINPVICYEIIFPNFVKSKNNDADVILNLTNDGWFGISSGPYQHFVASKFRAVENKTPVIRVSNSGISAYIDEYGQVVSKIGLNKIGFLEIEI